jgi:hypothetical protein
MIRFLVFTTLFFGSIGYALIAGGRSERWAAGLLATAALLTTLMLSSFPQRWGHFEFGTFLIDVALALALVVLSAVSDRYWPIWMSALQGVAVLTHTAVLFAPQIVPPVYGNAEQLLAYPMLCLLIVATYREQSRRRRGSTGRF